MWLWSGGKEVCTRRVCCWSAAGVAHGGRITTGASPCQSRTHSGLATHKLKEREKKQKKNAVLRSTDAKTFYTIRLMVSIIMTKSAFACILMARFLFIWWRETSSYSEIRLSSNDLAFTTTLIFSECVTHGCYRLKESERSLGKMSIECFVWI